MQTATLAPEPVRTRLFTAAEYYRMGEIGIFGPEERVELIEGHITLMSPINAPHATAVRRLHKQLFRQLDGRYEIDVQSTLNLTEASQPEPDATVLRPFDESKVPALKDVQIVIEVSDSTLRLDQTTKLRMYAAAGVPEYWIVNLKQRQIEVYTRPEGSRYADQTIYAADDTARSATVENLNVRVADLMIGTEGAER
ncbi:MAG: Uma2 family endonuclease [Catalinimonas sp.]